MSDFSKDKPVPAFRVYSEGVRSVFEADLNLMTIGAATRKAKEMLGFSDARDCLFGSADGHIMKISVEGKK